MGLRRAGGVGRLAAALMAVATIAMGATASAAVTAAPAAAELTPPPVPTQGAYLGASASVNRGETRLGAIERTERLLGRPLAIDHQFYKWDEPLITSVQTADAAAGRYPFVSWKPQRTNGQVVRWPSIASGTEDDYIRTVARRIRDFGHPMFMVFHHEPYNESINSAWGTPAEFAAAYRRVVTLFRQEGAANVAWVLVLTSWDYTQNRADAFYPGPEVIDWIAADPYNYFVRDGRWNSLATVAEDFYEWGSRTGKPLMLAEWGSTEDPNTPGRKAAWVDEAAATLAAWPNIRAAVYFNNVHTYDWRIDTSTSSLEAFRRLGFNSHFSPSTGPGFALDCSGAPTFQDVPAGHTHAAAIACAGAYGLLGPPAPRFEPDRPITRGELASFTMRALEAAGVAFADGRTNYSDIGQSPNAADIRRLADLGVLRGYTDGTFRPSEPVNRAQLGSILVRAHDVAAPDRPLAAASFRRFPDAAGSVHADAIERAARAGLLNGVRPGVFNPDGDATRGQVAAILTRLLRLLGSEGVPIERR